MRFLKQSASENLVLFENLKQGRKTYTGGNGKQTASANVIYTGGLLKKTGSDNHIFTGGVLSRPPVKIMFPHAVS
jgi:hypothetical protein